MRTFLSVIIFVMLNFNCYCQEPNSKTIKKNDSLLLNRYLNNLSLRNSTSKIDLKKSDYNLNNTNGPWNLRKPNASTQWLKGFPQSSLNIPNYGGPNYDPAPKAFRRNRIPYSTWIRCKLP